MHQLPSTGDAVINLRGLTIGFQPDLGVTTFEGVPMAMMWIASTLNGLMTGFQRMVGTERFILAMKGEGRRSVDGDWSVIAGHPRFEDGYKAIAAVAAIAGWGRWEMVRIDYAQKEAVFRVWNSWEGLYQLGARETWGNPMLAGKKAGYCSRVFGVNCWAEQTASVARGDEYDEFVVRQSDRSVEQELDDLLLTDQATRADMAIAMQKLRREIAERKNAEALLTAAKRTAEEASRAKSEFLANMSHEIRTPLSAIMGFSELLLGASGIQAEQRRYVEIIERNSRSLLQLINDILDLSRVETNQIGLEISEVSVARLVGEVRSLLWLQAQEKGLYLKTEFRGQVPETVRTDPGRLRQILINIVGNAVKFTAAGGIVVTVDARPEGGRSFLCIEVQDTGPGIPAAQMPQLFSPFSPGDSSYTKRHAGTGLGLAISRHLMGLLGGRIGVTSKPGAGTTFTLLLPLASAHEATDQDPAGAAVINPTHTGLRERPTLNGMVLVAEDQQDVRELIGIILRRTGLETVFAANGEEAEQLVRARGDIDLVIMDVQMPVRDGLTATRSLRDRGWSKPVIAMTAYAMTGDEQKCLDAGCNAYVSKPIDQDRLYQVLARFLPASSAPR